MADLEAIDAKTLAVCGAGASNAAGQIELARARVGASPAYRKRGVDVVTVPRADIEVDVDMENTNDGCYLWGVLVTDRRSASPEPRYVGFASWDPDIEAGELVAFEEFWSWLTEERARAAAEGATFRAYCYSRSAEQGQMKRLADRIGRGRRDEVDEFLASDEWVDLLEVVRDQLITGRSMGLKETAPLAGFCVADRRRRRHAGHRQVRAGHRRGGGSGWRAKAQEWILGYNEDDVRATAALREWLDGAARDLPSIEVARRSRTSSTGYLAAAPRVPVRGRGAPSTRGSACSRRCAASAPPGTHRCEGGRGDQQAEEDARGRDVERELVADRQGMERRVAGGHE